MFHQPLFKIYYSQIFFMSNVSKSHLRTRQYAPDMTHIYIYLKTKIHQVVKIQFLKNLV